MTENQTKLLHILREMFQFDQADLDFGIYRIMAMKREEVSRFVDEDLPAQITEGLNELAGLDTAADIAAIDKEIAHIKVASYSEVSKAANVAELEEKKNSLAGSVDVAAVEADVYNHLTNFFSRYYDDGDFISQRRYKDGAYAIPYEGEEVKLHWANADQYYVKTSEYFKDYTFKDKFEDAIRFKLVEADTENDNNKANEKRFFQLYTNQPFEVVDGALVIYMEYKNGGKKNQAECTAEIVAAFSAASTRYPKFVSILTINDGKTLLERQLNRYTARNTFDYFIHKDLGKFLNQELDFYIKNDVIFLDDIEEQDEAKTKEYLTKAKVIRKIARKIITFLAQLEDFQKRLYLKKKFIVETNYCITLDRVPESMYPEIAANEAQCVEWVRLFTIDEIEGDLTCPAYSVPLTIGFLKANPFLVLDTAFFGVEFKERLVDSINGLDEQLDGLMIHSENSQALSLLQEKYNSQITCVYADPPYNAKSSEILYKNNFKHSSWISMMNDRNMLASKLKTKKGALITAIDDNELNSLMGIYNNNFPQWIKTYVSIVHNPAGVQGDNFSYSHEYAAFAFENIKHLIGKTRRAENSEESFRDWGGTCSRSLAKNCFYPIIVKENNIIGFGDVCSDEFHPDSSNIHNPDGTISVYPISDDGEERKWVFARNTVESIYSNLNVKERNGVISISRIKDQTSYKTVWDDKKYYANIYGSKLLNNIMGKKVFDFPKSIYTLIDCLSAIEEFQSKKAAIALDYFAGSGTTGHAVISLNRDDGGNRKYILVEMGEYFDTATKPRIEKVVYSEDWKDGKPVSRNGSSHAFKYLRLESYEDALNNIVLRGGDYDLLGAAREGYLLSYILDSESAGSDSLLNLKKLDKPFSYVMNITRNLESTESNVDLVETFNYLIGLTVVKSHARVSFDADFATGEYGVMSAGLIAGDTYKFKAVEGTMPSGDKTLVLWREMTGDIEKDNAALDTYFLSLPDVRSFRHIYVNCDNNLLNLRGNGESWQVVLIDEEMKKRMFEDTE